MLFIISLGYLVFFTRILFLQDHAVYMFDYDPYTYLYKAITVNQNHQFVHDPFIMFLSSIYGLIDPSNAIFLTRNIITMFSIILFIFFYLIMKKICNQTISFIGACTSSFIPLFVSYSSNLHNDIFALTLGFISLYFSIMPRRFIQVGIASAFIILAGLTRPDALAGFLIPFVIGVSYYVSRKVNRNFYFILGIFLVIFAILVVMVGQSYYYQTTRFNPIDKIGLTFTYHNVMFMWNSLTQITSDDTINNIFLLTIAIGVIFSLITGIRIQHISFRNIQVKEEYFVVLFLPLTFVIYFVNLVSFHFPYTIVNNVVHFTDFVTPRYLLPLQILLFCGFTYVLGILHNRFHRSTSFNVMKRRWL